MVDDAFQKLEKRYKAVCSELHDERAKVAVMQTECLENSRMLAALRRICEATGHADYDAAVEAILMR